MEPVNLRIREILQDSRPVLITGETGTGKSWLAGMIHEYSNSADGRLVKVYCTGHSEEELRSELFGRLTSISDYPDQNAALSRARNGTLLIKNLNYSLLNLFNELHDFFYRSGNISYLNKIRLIVTFTLKPGQQLNGNWVNSTNATEDPLWHVLHLPPLRTRREEIPDMIQKYFNKVTSRYPSSPKGISFQTMYRCISYSWPGNIRELQNAIEYSSLLCDDIQIEDKNLPPYLLQSNKNLCSIEDHISQQSFISAERNLLYTILQISPNRNRAAELLGLSESVLQEYLCRYKLEHPNPNC